MKNNIAEFVRDVLRKAETPVKDPYYILLGYELAVNASSVDQFRELLEPTIQGLDGFYMTTIDAVTGGAMAAVKMNTTRLTREDVDAMWKYYHHEHPIAKASREASMRATGSLTYLGHPIVEQFVRREELAAIIAKFGVDPQVEEKIRDRLEILTGARSMREYLERLK